MDVFLLARHPFGRVSIDRDLGREVALHWVPEGPAVVAMVFFGWFYAGILVLLAFLVRRVVVKLKRRDLHASNRQSVS